MQRFAIQQQSMLGLAVIAESFAVVGDENNDCAIENAARGQAIDEPADDLVRIRDLSVVRLCVRVRRRRRVRRVRLIEMEKGEERLAGVAVDPGGQRVGGDLPVALRFGERFARTGDGQPVVEEIEPAIDAGLVAQHVRRDRGAGDVARGLEPDGECALGGRDGVADIVADAVMQGQPAAQQRRVRGQRERSLAEHLFEHEAIACQTDRSPAWSRPDTRTPAGDRRGGCRSR